MLPLHGAALQGEPGLTLHRKPLESVSVGNYTHAAGSCQTLGNVSAVYALSPLSGVEVRERSRKTYTKRSIVIISRRQGHRGI